MKTIKMLLTVTAITLISVFTGCSDQIVSTGETTLTSDSHQTSELKNKFPAFHSVIRIKPNRTFTFDYSNTGFFSIFSIQAENITFNPDLDRSFSKCQDFIIRTSTGKVKLDCMSSGINVKEIEITNTSSEMIDIDVILTGDRKTRQ